MENIQQSPIPYRFFYAVALPLLLVAIFFALRIMPAKGTSWLVHLDVGLAWFSAISTLVLVPTDVATTLEVSSDPALKPRAHSCLHETWLHRLHPRLVPVSESFHLSLSLAPKTCHKILPTESQIQVKNLASLHTLGLLLTSSTLLWRWLLWRWLKSTHHKSRSSLRRVAKFAETDHYHSECRAIILSFSRSGGRQHIGTASLSCSRSCPSTRNTRTQGILG